ncbi:MAG: DUF86 domain-containing protein [Nitrospinota bacterium]
MSKRGDLEYLNDMKEAIRRIQSYTKGFSYQKFLKDTKTQDAVIRNLEIIGEAAKNISPSLRRSYKPIDWGQVAGMRDRLIHQYFGVNWEIVWNVIEEKLPELKSQIGRILAEGKGQ